MSKIPEKNISVIITIYNRANTIDSCVRSLFKQKLQNIEYIFVDDGSKDQSLDKLKALLDIFPEHKQQTQIIQHETNKGIAAARQSGLQKANGEYIIHCDSDDWIDDNMYERLYRYAKENDADIVGCDFCHEFSDRHFIFHQQYAETIDENIRRLINGQIFPSLCTSLTKRKLITDNTISFPLGLNMGEDLFFNLQLYLKAKKIVGINWAPYHYRHTEDSSCIQRTRESIDSDITIAGMIEIFMKKNNLYEKYSKDIEYRKFFSKLPLIEDLNNIKNYTDWMRVYPETHNYIWRYEQIDWKRKTELWLAANKMMTMAKLFKYLLKLQNKIRHI